MASRREELNAYTFAKRRVLAAFLQPSATGSEENAPRPVRNVVPSLIVAVVILAVFGAWGLLKPNAPKGWDTPGEKVIIASKSTTRYVVLKTGDKVQLHPVLNMASAKLLLDPDKGQVVKVSESVLDSGKIPHGVTIGIPYAPDRLPDESDAGVAKYWAVCQRPGGKEDANSIQKAAFVFAGRDERLVENRSRLSGGELLDVQGPDKTRYIVDAKGIAYPLDEQENNLVRAVVGGQRKPQQVSKDWLDTLDKGDPITFPNIDNVNENAGVEGELGADANRVGMVLRARDGGVWHYYVVLRGEVAPISDFTATLLLQDPDLVALRQADSALTVESGSFTPRNTEFSGDRNWPSATPKPVNSASTAKGAVNTVCNVLRSVDKNSGITTLSTWAGSSFPASLPSGSSSAYVTPGSGQLFRQFQGSQPKAGAVFLVTDTGLRYALQSNGDSSTDGSGIGQSGENSKEQMQEAQQAQALLGYENVDPSPVPLAWSNFLPTGPRLSRADASQPQGS